MADIFDYMVWRGDLTFERDSLGDIDNLILSRAAYLPLDNIVPESYNKSISLGEAVRKFLELPDASARVCLDADIKLCRAILNCPRFATLPVCGYENVVDPERELQFSAMVFSISPEKHFVGFRGTDNTIVGWKEDFNMSFITPVPSQLEAKRYLHRVAQELPGELIPGGHSKGGNLAVYASAYATPELQARINDIYTNDGPGFESAVLLTDGYLAISDKIRSFVPQSSVVGMMLEHEEDYTIIKSRQMSVWQHDLYSWEVLGKNFVGLDRVTNSSKFIDNTLKAWLADLTKQQREQFIDAVFSLLAYTNAETFSDLTASKMATIKSIVKSAAGLDEYTRNQMLYALGRLVRSARENVGDVLPRLQGRKAESADDVLPKLQGERAENAQ